MAGRGIYRIPLSVHTIYTFHVHSYMAVHSVVGGCVYVCYAGTGTRRRRGGEYERRRRTRTAPVLTWCTQFNSSRGEASRAEARRAELDSIRAATTFSLMKTLLRFPPVCNATLHDVACVNEPRLRATLRSHGHSV